MSIKSFIKSLGKCPGIMVVVLCFTTEPSAMASVSLATGGNVTVDYQTTTVTGSPYVFGYNHNPDVDHVSVLYPELADMGFTRGRQTVYFDALDICPSVAAWNANKNDCQNPDNWDWDQMWWLPYHNNNNIKLSMIFAYCPTWLSYSGNMQGIPKYWSIYEAIVKKVYTKYASSIQWAEILNEPDASWFMDLTGSSYTSQTTAVVDFYYHIAKAKGQERRI